ncbi:MAG: GIY-YIG nuclease family protein [Brumimicrobium sp.]
MTKYYTYVLKSLVSNQYYIGQTDNMENRLIRHNNGYEKYTKSYRPWKIVLKIEKPNRSQAIILERKLKNLGRDRLLKFIDKYG